MTTAVTENSITSIPVQKHSRTTLESTSVDQFGAPMVTATKKIGPQNYQSGF